MSCCDSDEGGDCTCGYRAACNALERSRRLGQRLRWTRSDRFSGFEQTFIDGWIFTRATEPGIGHEPQPQYGDNGNIIYEPLFRSTSKSVEKAWEIIQKQDETIRQLREQLKRT